ncbi:MAG TPA: head decoration protein [Clostridiales bacterium]|nr:head decoration protein [Clostridiales bacterium]
MASLNKKIGTVTYSNLIAGMDPPVHINSGTIRKLAVETTYPRGTVLSKSSGTAGDGKLVILGTTAATDETLTPNCVLCDDVVVGAATDVNTTVYTAGCFNADALTVKDAYTMTEADKDKLRERGIYLGIVFE